MSIKIDDEFKQEIAGIYALYGKAFANGFEKAPSYLAEDVENFLGYNVEPALERLVEEGLLDREYSEFLEDDVYRMTDKEAKADALITWNILEEEFDESTNEMFFNFNETEKLLSNRNIQYAQ